jgi:hypothetical protein
MPAPAVRLVPIGRLGPGAELAAEVLPIPIHRLFFTAAPAMFTGHGSLLRSRASKEAARPAPDLDYVPTTLSIWLSTRITPFHSS